MPRPKLRTTLCDLLGIEYPIVLAGMGSRGKATLPAEIFADLVEGTIESLGRLHAGVTTR